MQQDDEGGGWTQIMQSGSSLKRRVYPFGHAANIVWGYQSPWKYPQVDPQKSIL